jgi:hypothetical protein
MSSKKAPRKAGRDAAQAAPARPAKHVHDLSQPGAANSEERLCWRFGYVDHDGPWGFDEVEPSVLREILVRLANFESMTLNEVFHRGGYPGKDYDVADIPNSDALDRLEVMGLADQTKIWVLRLGGEPRLYGLLRGNIFEVVFWDPEHEIWPSVLKHT